MEPTRFFGLGGMEEIGKSNHVIEYKDEIILIDAGIKFVNSMVTGADGLIPDWTYLKNKGRNVKALFITHGHEDHMGGIPYLVQEVDLNKIYAPRLAIAYIKAKLLDKGVKWKGEFIEIEKDMVVKFENIIVDFWTTQHSIPDSFGIRVKTPNGTIMDTGDFRFDYTPIGEVLTDFSKIEEMGKEGVDILISESTNAMSPDHSPTERHILKDIEKIIVETKGKVIFTTFASNVNRLLVVMELAKKHKKKVCLFGRSMVNSMKIVKSIEDFNIPEDLLIDKNEISKYPDNELLICTTGSQGEELAALNRMTIGKHHQVVLKKGDVVIFSSNPIPGNRMKVELLINKIYKSGAEAREHRIDGQLHTSGHAYKDELIKLINLTKPKYFLPCHGSHRQAAVHAHVAMEAGVKEKNCFVLGLGDVVELTNHELKRTKEKVDAGPIYIDGGTINRSTSYSLRVREKLGRNGFINISVLIDKKKNEIIGKTRVLTKGAIFVKESKELMDQIQKMAHGAILYTIKNNKKWKKSDIKNILESRIGKFFYQKKRRNPIIVTTVMTK